KSRTGRRRLLRYASLAAVLAAAACLAVSAQAAAPDNDAFASALQITGPNGSITGTTPEATKETGEPNHGSNTGGHSTWYSWTAPAAGTVVFDTLGSSFDTLLGVYVGTSVDALATIASNDDIVDNVQQQSRVSFGATSGTTYLVAVDGWRGNGTGAIGNVTL